MAMHVFAQAIETCKDVEEQTNNRIILGILASEHPRLQSILEHGGAISSATFSRDGARILTTSGLDARVWETKTGKLHCELKGIGGAIISSAAFSPDGKRIVTGAYDGTARVWDATTGDERSGEPLAKGFLHQGYVKYVAFSRNGEMYLSASDDKTVMVWDASTFKPLVRLKGHSKPVRIVKYSEDGPRRILTASDDGTAVVWDAEVVESLAEMARSNATYLTVGLVSNRRARRLPSPPSRGGRGRCR
jgi:WD40 repeat protein